MGLLGLCRRGSGLASGFAGGLSGRGAVSGVLVGLSAAFFRIATRGGHAAVRPVASDPRGAPGPRGHQVGAGLHNAGYQPQIVGRVPGGKDA